MMSMQLSVILFLNFTDDINNERKCKLRIMEVNIESIFENRKYQDTYSMDTVFFHFIISTWDIPTLIGM